MARIWTALALVGLALGFAATGRAQSQYLPRLPVTTLDVAPPSARIEGEPGTMRVVEATCWPRDPTGLRQRIVDVAAQEWAFFGFNVVDQTRAEPDGPRRRSGRRVSWLDAEASARVATSIAGYWAVTADGPWILNRQNQAWAGPNGIASRWRDPWSAAFISWVMCESGLTEGRQFRRAIAHHPYIDQAIAARDSAQADAAFVAHDVGEVPIEPGDLLCSARRAAYRTIAERRSQLGIGVRSHCDIVVGLDEAHARILAIGGNVRGAVSLKLLPAQFDDRLPGHVRAIGRDRRAVFAHLKLRAAPAAASAFRSSPALRAAAEHGVTLDRLLPSPDEGPLEPGSVRVRDPS